MIFRLIPIDFKISENLSESSPRQILAQETCSRCINSSRGGYRRVRTGHYHGYETAFSRYAERGWKWNRAVQSATAICRSGDVTRVVNRGETRFDPFRRVSLDATLPLEKPPPCLLYSSHSHRLVSRESQPLRVHQI